MRNPNKIVQNTGFLYVRMLITMAIMLYTSRVLLDLLGAEGYGLYHVLAGVVVLLGFLQGALSSTTQRFIAIELGRKDSSQLASIFSMSVTLHVLFALTLAIVAYVAGYVWLLELINFGETEPQVVFGVYVLAIASFAVNLVVLPCHAVVIAHERMRVFAWFGILEAVLKLAIVLLLPYLASNTLLTYAALLLAVSTLMGILYFAYVLMRVDAIQLRWLWDIKMFRTLASFSGWSMWGSAAAVLANQGTNLLINVFFGPAINAAKSIGTQASGALNQFVINMQSAVNPQLIKSYSANDRTYTNTLVYLGAKYNFFLISILAIPVLVYTQPILKLWLIDVPDYTSTFLRLMLATVIVDSISKPLMTAAQATGKIKMYQAVVGGVLLLNIPVSLAFLILGYGPTVVFYVALAVVVLALLVRVAMLKRIFEFSVRRFTVEVLLPVGRVGVLLGGLAWLVTSLLAADGLLMLLLGIAALMAGTLVIIIIAGFAAIERRALLKLIHRP